MAVLMNRGRSCPLCGAVSSDEVFRREKDRRWWRLLCCAQCGLHYTDPQPTASDIARFYSGDYHAGLRSPGASEKAFGEKYERYAAWIASFLPAGRCLDVGCATGLFPYMLRRRGYEAEGLELNPESAAWGSAHYGVPVAQGTLADAAAWGRRYDLISMTDVLEHAFDPLDELRLARRMLNPGGFLLVTFPDILSLESRYYRLLSALARRDLWRTCSIPYHVWEFSRPTAEACFQRAGFSVAAFRRSQLRETLAGKWKLFSIPPMFLWLPPAAARWGTQMEFMLRCAGEED
jgi:2-polyprenyl-3-methyl-5-hydroxy-6-metoxy-1,4-benzoquinol methylase